MAVDVIVPDNKDWTWVLESQCPECGFEASTVAPTDVAGLIRGNAVEWERVLGASPETLRTRPKPDRWSPLEYGAHVRDVYRIFHERFEEMLQSDDPLFADWNQDVTATAQCYNEQDPSQISTDLVAAASDLAELFETVEGEQWQRPGRRSDGASFTVATFARYLVHDPVHHLWDAGQP